jgi:alpha/beta superfamily hydrolase
MTPQLHRTVFFPGPAGRIEAIYWSAAENHSGPAPLSAVVCHPHPLFGGTMHNKVVYQTAKTLHRFGLPVLRFNFRGVGASEGRHDHGHGERDDVTAALDFLTAEYPGAPLLLAGFSFGAWVGLRVACDDPRVQEMIGLGLPVGSMGDRDFSYLNTCDKPKLLASGEFDSHSPPHVLRSVVEQFPVNVKSETTVAVISGADHFFTGHLADLDSAISNWIAARNPNLATSA